jgi:NAD(P)-dependent dehydrogenase (short-subunit alcohol dehydrogenase family)
MASNYDLKDKVALVTGAGRGIGRTVALGLAACGAKVVLASRTKEELDRVVDEIKQNGGEAYAQVADLMNSEQIDALVKATVKTYDGLDILINNAATSIMVPLMDLREDGWDKIFGINCKAVFLLSLAAAIPAKLPCQC